LNQLQPGEEAKTMVEQPIPRRDIATASDLDAERPDFHAGVRSEFNRLMLYMFPALVVSFVLAFLIGKFA
jgi:hypothetical protein